MLKSAIGLLSTFALFWLGLGAGLWWEHRSGNWPAIPVHIPFVYRGTLGFGEGPAAEVPRLRKALVDPDTKRTWEAEARERAADLKTCRGNTEALTAAAGRQNAAVAGLRLAGERMTRDATKAVQAASLASRGLSDKAADLLAHPATGPDACARAWTAFSHVKESVR